MKNKHWYKNINNSLSKEAKIAKSYVLRICKLLSKLGNRNFHVEMNANFNVYEGHIFDDGKYIETSDDVFELSELGDDIGMIHWGGYYSRKKHKDALSKAWISLLEDCIGSSPDRELAECHNLTKSLELFGPKIDLNCKTLDKLEEILKKMEV